MNNNLSFKEKLEILYEFIFDKKIEIDIEKVPDHFSELPIYNSCVELKIFFNTFSKHEDFMKCLFNIKNPSEIQLENDIMIIAIENQGVCKYGYDKQLGKIVYIDDVNNVKEEISSQISDFLLNLIAIQCTAYLECSGNIENCCNVLNTKYSQNRITDNINNEAVYYFKEGVLLAINGTNAYVSSKNDDIMQDFEQQTNFNVDYF